MWDDINMEAMRQVPELTFMDLFKNYLKSHNYSDEEKVEPTKHLLQIDLAIYDEI